MKCYSAIIKDGNSSDGPRISEWGRVRLGSTGVPSSV